MSLDNRPKTRFRAMVRNDRIPKSANAESARGTLRPRVVCRIPKTRRDLVWDAMGLQIPNTIQLSVFRELADYISGGFDGVSHI